MQCISCYSPVILLYKCEGCPATFTQNVWDVHARLTGHHLRTWYLTCECRSPMTFFNYNYDFKFHFQCPLCGRQCASKGGLSNHKNSCQVKNKILLGPAETFLECMDTT